MKIVLLTFLSVLLLSCISTGTQFMKHVRACTWTLDDGPADFHTIQEDTDRASIKHWSMRAIKSHLKHGLGTRSMDIFQLPFEASGRRGFENEVEWGDFAYVGDDSAELVIGLSDMRPDSYSELVDLVMSYGGEAVNTVSMDDKISAVVADIPHEFISTFASEIEIAGLSRYIEPNIRFEIDFIPNDPDWPKQWGPQKIEADWAWNTTMGDSSVLVAVVDTGIDWNHPDLADNYVPLGYDWANNDSDPMDDHGHGTHCAGVIAAVINNNIGIAGLAQVRVMAEKGLGPEGGWADDLAKAIVHAVDQGADIISCSWGSYVRSTLLHEAVRYAYDHGVLVVAAAGNRRTDIKHYPAAYDEVIAVTATDQDDDPASFTNFGNWVEVAAPGVKIYSTVWDDSYANMSGTSMSAPHVSGVAALIWSQFPSMTRDQVWAQLQYTAEDLGDPGFDVYYGFGRINARRAVEQAPAEHDVLILNWKTPSYIRLGSITTINTTILNMGASDESDVTIQLLVKGSVVDSVTVGFLASGLSTSVSCSWSPIIEGIYNVTSYVVPIIGETIINNNALSTHIRVRAPQVIKVPDDYDKIQKAIDAAFEGDTVFVASGTYYEKVWINKEDLTLVGEDQKNTIIDGQRRADVVLVTVDGIKISGFTLRNSSREITYAGICVWMSEDVTIINTTTVSNYHGIFLYSSVGVTLRNNNMTRNTYNFGVNGDGLGDFIHDIDASNTVDGKPLYYWINEHNRHVPFDAGYVAVVNSTNIVVKDLNLTKNFEGVLFAYAVNSSIENVNASDNYYGIYLAYSNNNTAHSNAPINNYAGIHLHESENNNVNDNMPINNTNGLSLYYSKDNTIDFNKLLDNDFGLFLAKSNNNTVASNKALKNTYGIYVTRSCYNAFKDNNMTANEYNFGVVGNHLSHFIQEIDISNTVDGKPVYYWINQKDREIPADAGYVAVINSTNVVVRDLNLTNNVHGVLFAFTAESLIENVKTTNNTYGIYLYGSSNNTMVYNTVTSKGKRGIQLINSSNNAIGNNMITNNYIGIGLWLFAENNTISRNAVLNGTSGGVGLYLESSCRNAIGDNAIINNYDGIYLRSSDSNTMSNNNIVNNFWGGIHLRDSDGNTIQSNTAMNNVMDGIWLLGSQNNIVTYNTLLKNGFGISLEYGSDDNIIRGNKATDGAVGIHLSESRGNIISENTASNNKVFFGLGICLEWSSENNTIVGNTIIDNYYGIMLSFWTYFYGLPEQNNNNTIYHNNFITNTKQVLSLKSINTWDNGYPSGGNYWSDYADRDLYDGPYQNETGYDGIWDHPYVIDGDNQDNYPLVTNFWYWSNPLLGDLNFDRKVDMQDIYMVARHFGSYPGHPRWNPGADLNTDSKVDMKDIWTVAKNFGKKWE